jgi:SAM-dependent methyltransferase
VRERLRSQAEHARTLWTLWRNEREEPEPFYRHLAREAVDDLERRYGPVAGTRIADLGCGPGFYADELRARGATVVPLDGDLAEMTYAGPPPDGGVVGDAGRLPFPDATFDGVFCSNLLEHASDTAGVTADLARVAKPGAWGYLSWTNWYSPWGGHDMTPYQFLGPRLGPRLYERRNGPPRKNRYGEGLFAVHIGPTLRLLAEQELVDVERVEPRYWPWARLVTKVPGLREVVTWNCVIRFRRPTTAPAFDEAWQAVEGVSGWLTRGQARLLWDAAARVRPGGTIVEIGSYHGRSAAVLARAAAPGVAVVAIDPHAGNDRGPQQWHGTPDEGESDHDAFLATLERTGVAHRVRHVRQFSQQALPAVDGPVHLLYVDGAHGYRPASEDLRRWGDRVANGGEMAVHDAYSSLGVTLALLRWLLLSNRWEYVGRRRSLVLYRRRRLSRREQVGNVGRQLANLPWFARNLLIKALIVARLGALAPVLGHREGGWPY